MDERLDFKETVDQIKGLTPKQQATFLYLLVQVLTVGVLRTLVRYAFIRIDRINSEMPEGPEKEHWQTRRKGGARSLTKQDLDKTHQFYIDNLEEDTNWGLMNNPDKQDRW